jgi:hypothetical protein
MSGISIWTTDIFLHMLKYQVKIKILKCLPGYPEHLCEISNKALHYLGVIAQLNHSITSFYKLLLNFYY